MGYDGSLLFDTKVDTSGFNTGVSKISSIASTALGTFTGNLLTKAVDGIKGIAESVYDAGSSFEAQMSKVSAISGASGKDLDALTAKAKEMGAKTKFSATEAGEAFQYMAMAGWSTNDMMSGIASVMNLAAASGEDLASVSDIVTDDITAFGHSASDASGYVDTMGNSISYADHFADVLAATSSNSNTNVELMGDTFKYVGAVAGAMGYSIEDMSLAVGLMANAGIKGSTAGTALRQTITQMAKPTKQSKDAMDALGLSLTDGEGHMKSFKEIMVDLRKGMSGMTEDQKAYYAAELAGQEGMSGLLAIVNASDADFNKLSDSITDCTGSAQKMADTMNQNLEGAITILKSSLEGLAIDLYDSVKGPLTQAAEACTQFVNDAQSAFEKGGWNGLAASIGQSMADIVSAIAKAIPQVVNVATEFIAEFGSSLVDNAQKLSNSGELTEIIVAIGQGILNGASSLATTAVGLLDALGQSIAAAVPQLTGCAGTVIQNFGQYLVSHSESLGESAGQIVALLGQFLAQHITDIIDIGKQFIAGFAQGFVDGVSSINDSVGSLLQGFIDGFSTVMGPIIDGVEAAFQGIADALGSIDPNVATAIGNALGVIAANILLLNGIGTAIGNVQKLGSAFGGVKTALDAMSSIPDAAGSITKFGQDAAAAFQLITQDGASVKEAMDALFGEATTKFAGIGAVLTGATTAVTAFVSMIQSGFSAAKEAIMLVGIAITTVGAILLGAAAWPAVIVAAVVAGIATIVVLIHDNWDSIVSFFQSGIQTVLGFLQSIPGTVGGFFSSIFSTVGSFFTTIGTTIASFFTSLPGTISGFFSSVFSTIGTFFATIGSTVLSFFMSLPGLIGGAISSLWSTITGFVQNIWTTVATAVPQIVSTIGTALQNLPATIGYGLGVAAGTIASWVVNLGILAIQAGQTFITNVGTFFSQLPANIWNFLTSAASAVVSWATTLGSLALQAGSQFLANVITFFQQLPGNVMNFLSSAASAIASWASSVAASAMQAGSQFLNNIVSFFSQLPGRIGSFLSSVISAVASWAGNMISNAQRAGSQFLSSVISFFSQLPGKIGSTLSSAIHAVSSWASNLVSTGARAASQFASSVINGIKSIPGKVASVGADIVHGIWSGISGAAGWLADKVKSFASGVVAGFKSAFKIGSPSKVMAREIGKWIPAGIAVGSADAIPQAKAQMAAQARDLVTSMQASVNAAQGPVNLTTGSTDFNYGALGRTIGGAMSDAVAQMTFKFDDREVGRMVRAYT